MSAWRELLPFAIGLAIGWVAMWLRLRKRRAAECDRLVEEMHVALQAGDERRLQVLRAQWDHAFRRLGRSTLGRAHHLTRRGQPPWL